MIATIQKDIEKESNLLKMPREFLVGGKETWKINENGLGVAYRAKLVRLWRSHPLKWSSMMLLDEEIIVRLF